MQDNLSFNSNDWLTVLCNGQIIFRGNSGNPMSSMFQTPAMQNLMQQMSGSPGMFQNMMQSPYMQDMMQRMVQNPELMASVSHSVISLI